MTKMGRRNILLFPIQVVVTLLTLIIAHLAKLFAWLFSAKIAELDKKHHFKEDFHIIPFFFKAIFCYLINLKRRRYQNWYQFVKHVKQGGDHLAISYTRPITDRKGEFEVEEYTYQQTYDIVLRLSHILHYQYGVESGDFIGIDSTNKPLFLFLWLAAWNIGAVPAFINSNVMGKPLVHSLKVANLSQVFVESDSMELIKLSEEQITLELPHIAINYIDNKKLMSILHDGAAPQFLQNDDTRSPPDLTDFKPSMLIYTSGTTGLPKAAIMSWRKSTIGCELFAQVMHMTNKSIVFTAMPLFHSTAALLGVCAVFSKGGCIALAPKFSASCFWKQVYLTQATHIQYVGELCRYLLRTPVSKYESMHTAKIACGNGLRPDIWQAFRNRFKLEVIGEFYAATEAPFATTSFQRGSFGIGACRSYGTIINFFLAYQQTLVKMDPDDDALVYRNNKGFCEVPPVGEPGEMLMRIFFPRKPETSFQGYLGNKKETDSKVLRDVFRKGDAWYRCGDLLKSDQFGQWYFVDRLGDTFRWKSENVSTTEVEDEIITSNKDAFAQVVVVGIKIPGYEGRAGFALIKLSNAGITEDQKLQLLNNALTVWQKELPKYALPIFVRFVKEFDMTSTNKVRKGLYRSQVFPKGENGEDVLYWLSDHTKYALLTQESWDSIQNQVIKL